MFPRVIGGKLSNVLGMTCGSLMPFLTAGVWIWVGNLQGTWRTVCIVVLALLLILTILYVFNEIFSRGKGGSNTVTDKTFDPSP